MDTFIICGLGSLGQHCVLTLKEFGVKIIAIEYNEPKSWEIPQIPHLVDQLIFADCRQPSILQQANIESCRSALLVTTSEQVNVETALMIRQLNPNTRLIMRSAKENLNELLQEQLGNFIAYEPTQLPASAFALAALGTETKGIFTLDGQRFQVIQRQIPRNDKWCNIRLLHELQTRTRRLLTIEETLDSPLTGFYQWKPNAVVQAGDVITHIELSNSFNIYSLNRESTPSNNKPSLKERLQQFKEVLTKIWQRNFQQQGRRVALICGLTVFILWLMGTILIFVNYEETTPLSAFSATAILLLGGYADLFGEFEQIDEIPTWLQLFSLAMTIAGTAFVGVLYALLTEGLLSAKFSFKLNRPPIPEHNHIIIVGLGRVGQRVATLLNELKQTLVGITLKHQVDPTFLPQMSLIVGDMQEVLSKTNMKTAKSMVVVTDDEILNLEVALMAQRVNKDSNLVIRTMGVGLGQRMGNLLPHAQVFGAYAVASEVFAGAAFGENIITIFRLGQQTILVTEYNIETEDTLHGYLIAEIAYGYGVVPILYQNPPSSPRFLPSDDLRLRVGDRLVVLATSDGLRRIEQGIQAEEEKRYYLALEIEEVLRRELEKDLKAALKNDSIFESTNVTARISGCSLDKVHSFMKTLLNDLENPSIFDLPLYKHQGLRLVRALEKVRGVKARLTDHH